MSKSEKGVSRRDLLTFWRRPLKELSEARPPAPSPRPPPLRPPGMMHEEILLDRCIRCGKCVAECPADAIFPLDASWGRAAGTPAIDARKQPCVLCTGLKCTHVCPSGALLPTFVNRDVVMGTAKLDPRTCVTHHGLDCDVCHKQCPIPGAIVIEADYRVRVDEALCVGCGLCEKACPTEPTSIHVVPRA